MGYSDPGPSPRTARRIASELAELLARSGIAGPVVLVGASIAGFDVRVFASDHPERAAGLVLVDASHEDQAHEVPPMARFVPLLSTIGVLRLFGVSFGQRVESLAPSVRQFARATSFRAAGYQAAADEIIHIRESASEVRSSRRKLTIPVVVVTGGTRSRRELATVATRSSLAVRTRMSDDRSRVRSRRVGRPTRGRCGRDPDCRGDSQRARCPPLRYAAANVEREPPSAMNLRQARDRPERLRPIYPACRSAWIRSSRVVTWFQLVANCRTYRQGLAACCARPVSERVRASRSPTHRVAPLVGHSMPKSMRRPDGFSARRNLSSAARSVFDVLDDVERHQRIEVVVLADHS